MLHAVPETKGSQPLLTRIEDMAAHYVTEIRALQPEGPYFLGGNCLGGTIAFEMAQQLQAQGQPVALLALLDASPPPMLFRKSFVYYRKRIGYHLQRRPDFLLSYAGTYLRNKIRHTIKMPSMMRSRNPLMQRVTHLEAVHGQARLDYVPQTYTGRVTCFWSDEYAHVEDYNMAWTKLAAGGIETHVVPGTPGRMFEEPVVQILADQLRVCLEEVRGEP